MKNYGIICALSAAAALLSVSCSKENSSIDPQNPEGAKTIQISISGEFSDFASTKASVESIFRMKWAESENVYVYGTSDGSTISNLGTLRAKIVDGSDSRVADLSGEITAPSSGTKLTLVYSPLFTSAPSVSSGAITQSLKAQKGGAGDVTFIAYATVDYGGATTSTYRTSFKFASSVLRVNVSGMDQSQALTGATISGIETSCKLTISTSAEPTVEGETSGNIVKTFSSVSTNASGNIAFYIALPVTTANAERSLSIEETGSHTYLYPKFGTGAVTTGGNMLNTIAAIPTPVKYTENSLDLGCGIFIPETGVIWAPVNCGYDATHTYGLLYQWGRAYGQGYDGETPEVNNTYYAPAFTSHVDTNNTNKDKFYYNGTLDNWYGGSEPDKLWDTTGGSGESHTPAKSSYDPCPAGWRVPTYAELNALFGNHSSPWTTTFGSQKGAYFNGIQFPGNTGVFLPYAGYRFYNYGVVFNRGDYGYYWSSSVNGDSAKFLRFSIGSAHVTSGSRANGYSVRCVQE